MVCAAGVWVARALILALALPASSAAAQAATPASPQDVAQVPAGSSIVRGVITIQGDVPLAGALVSLQNDGGEVASVTSEADGTYQLAVPAPGPHRVVIVADGFETVTELVTVAQGQTVVSNIDLKVAALAESVDVVASNPVVPSTGTLTSSQGLSGRQIEELVGGAGLSQALRLLASVIEVPGGVSIKGGRPSQATVQLGPGTFVDPATGLSPVSLPDDAIDSVTVLPNPYAVEYGRFSSGLVLIQTRRASDRWRTRLNNLDPSFRTKRDQPFSILGFAGWSPRFEAGGPLVSNKLFVQQAVQYRYRANDIGSRPQSEVKTSNRLSSYTRLDANLTPRHTLMTSAGFFPARASQTNLGTFTPPEASVDMRGNVTGFGVTERSLWSDTLFSETTVGVYGYDTTVLPRGAAPMDLLPEIALGNHFNRQERHTSTIQVVETISGTTQGRGGLHLFKVGVDVLHSRYSGSSTSQTVSIRRSDGSLSRRLDFGNANVAQSVQSTDLALFAQDRLQPTNRWYVEAGVRLDRDGILQRFNVTPRVGSAILLNEAGTSVIRSGYGLFFERTPSVAGVFEQFESPLDTRFAADGVTPLGPSTRFRFEAAPDLRTSRSHTWDLGLDHRFNQSWSTHVGVIDRRGSRDLIVAPQPAATDPRIVLTSDGRSVYREAEVSVHYAGWRGMDVNVSYVRALARADLNAYTMFFDNILYPVIAENRYAPARTEVPHRLLARGRAMPIRDWLVVGLLDWRSGLPYSLVDDALDFVGDRNALRFPTYIRADLGLEHRFTFGKLRPWIGVRADNAFSSFLPQDVQANVTSPSLGTFYNTEYRQFRIQVRFER